MLYRATNLHARQAPLRQLGEQVISKQIKKSNPSISIIDNNVSNISKSSTVKQSTIKEALTTTSESIYITNLAVLIVSTNYARKLDLVLQSCQEIPQIHTIFVSTDKNDILTQNVCQKYTKVSITFWDFKHGNAIFDKGCALRSIQEIAHKNEIFDGFLILDSDIILPQSFSNLLQTTSFLKGHLYGPRSRYIVYNEKELYENPCKRREAPKFSWIIGFFQLYTKEEKWLYVHSKNASSCDNVFANHWPKRKQHKISLDVIHLGRINANWNGIKTEDFIWNN